MTTTILFHSPCGVGALAAALEGDARAQYSSGSKLGSLVQCMRRPGSSLVFEGSGHRFISFCSGSERTVVRNIGLSFVRHFARDDSLQVIEVSEFPLCNLRTWLFLLMPESLAILIKPEFKKAKELADAGLL
jgi:hypothetical protein